MPSPSWAAITSPIVALKRTLQGKGDKDKKDVPSPSTSSVQSPIRPPPPTTPNTQQRFTRRDQLPTRTQKFRQDATSGQSKSFDHPSVSMRRDTYANRGHSVAATQAWPDPRTLLKWVDNSLGNDRNRARSVTPTRMVGNRTSTTALPVSNRTRNKSESGWSQRPTWNWTTETELIPIRGRSASHGRLEDRRSTGERLAAWLRSLSRERLDRGEEEEKREWRRSRSQREYSEKKSSIPPRSNQHRSVEGLNRIGTDFDPSTRPTMPASACCSNCYTKYSMLNKEEGCSACALSFCKRCVGWRAVIPNLSSKPISVCRSCHDRLQAEAQAKQRSNATISHAPLPSRPSESSSVGFYPQLQQRQQHHVPPPASTDPPPPYSATTSSVYPRVAADGGVHGVTPWWSSADLPPPSMRADYGRGSPSRPDRPLRHLSKTMGGEPQGSSEGGGAEGGGMTDIEQRAKMLKDGMEPTGPPPTIESIEERLAALRGCNVESVRNPRVWLEQKAAPQLSEADTVAQMLEEARDRAKLEERFDPDRMIEERAARLMKKEEKEEKESGEGTGEEGENKEADSDARLLEVPSVASRMSGISSGGSDATNEELAEIDRLMGEAKKRIENSKQSGHQTPSTTVHWEGGEVERPVGEEDVKREMDEATKITKQVSLDIDKVNAELSDFWTRQNIKKAQNDEDDSSDGGEVDDETVARIVKEAEEAPDEEPPAVKKTVGDSHAEPSSPEKKKNLFGRLFKK